MVLVTWFVTVWGGALLWLARLARRAPCGPGHARTGRALFGVLHRPVGQDGHAAAGGGQLHDHG
uniref:hypothetical protein n=1 Tax=Oceanithermus sp. TaxID=2268145 RepID=UPI00257D6D4B